MADLLLNSKWRQLFDDRTIRVAMTENNNRNLDAKTAELNAKPRNRTMLYRFSFQDISCQVKETT